MSNQGNHRLREIIRVVGDHLYGISTETEKHVLRRPGNNEKENQTTIKEEDLRIHQNHQHHEINHLRTLIQPVKNSENNVLNKNNEKAKDKSVKKWI